MSDFLINTALKPQLLYVGVQQTPVLIIDDLVLDLPALLTDAASADFQQDPHSYYPGIRAMLPRPYVIAVLNAVYQLIYQVYQIPPDRLNSRAIISVLSINYVTFMGAYHHSGAGVGAGTSGYSSDLIIVVSHACHANFFLMCPAATIDRHLSAFSIKASTALSLDPSGDSITPSVSFPTEGSI